MSNCVAQGHMSVESVGRLVEVERLASQMSPQPNFERTLSWNAFPCRDDDAPVAIARSISDSLADVAFTMELGECDVDQQDDAASRPRRISSYTESPYCYSFCPDNDEVIGLCDGLQSGNGAGTAGTRNHTTKQQWADCVGTLQKIRCRHLLHIHKIEDPIVDFGSSEGGAAHEGKGRRDSSKTTDQQRLHH